MARQKRRGRGEGSIFQRKDGRWEASFYLEDGSRKSLYGRTQKEALEKLRLAMREQEQGTLVKGTRETVGQHIEHWLENVHKPAIRISTYFVYRGILNKHILPALGHIQLQKLTVQHVEAFYARKVNEGLSAKTIRSIHAVLHRALAHAVYSNLLVRNVCDIAKKSLPRQTRYEIRPLTEEQARQLIVKVRGHQLEALLILAITTGMRRGELLALRWQDINFNKRYLQVRRSVRRVPGYRLHVSEPKTQAGRRKIMPSSFLMRVLARHRVGQLEMRLKAGTTWEDHDLVFCNDRGSFIEPDNLLVRFKKVLQEIGLPSMRFHDLRHSAATILMSMGVPAKVVQEILGHSSITMTMDIYSHVLPSLQADAMDKMSGLFDVQDDHQDSGEDNEQAK